MRREPGGCLVAQVAAAVLFQLEPGAGEIAALALRDPIPEQDHRRPVRREAEMRAGAYSAPKGSSQAGNVYRYIPPIDGP
jgi:hypothetical protein